jgi:DNA-directed RNA polymerase specialized sigma24 family protein
MPAARAGRRGVSVQRSAGGAAPVGAAAGAGGTGGERGAPVAAVRPSVGDRSAASARLEPGCRDAIGLSMLRYDPHLDGLFTYCLSAMCEHDAAITALGEALVLAERQHERDRAPAQRGLRRPWLYALVRWACLRRLAERARREGGAETVPATAPHLSDAARTQRRRELAALAWPEAAGTSPEQREALELAVRHGLPAAEVAAVLGLAPEATSVLLSHAACEVERTRAALAVVESGGCAAVARLAGDERLVLGAAFRRELLRHVDDCAECRRAAERAMAGVPWPGTAPAGTAELAVLEAPRPAIEAAVLAVRRARCQHNPRFDRAGFPVTEKDKGARRDRLRGRAIATTVVATVIAAPVLALWAAYRGAPFTGESDGAGISASEHGQRAKVSSTPYENTVQEGPHGPNAKQRKGVGPYGGKDGHHRSAHPRGPQSSAGAGSPGGDGQGGDTGRGAGHLTVDASPTGDATLIRLTASGSSPVSWSADSDAPWLALSRTSGVLRPGESTTLRVTLDRGREPGRPWAGHITVAPSDAVVTIKGRGQHSPPPSSDDPGTHPPSQEPTTPPPSEHPSPSSPPSEDPSSPSGRPSDSDGPAS